MPKPDGGPAFPGAATVDSDGMTLRDWFASQALPALQRNNIFFLDGPGPMTDSELARRAYEIADAMIAARAKV